MLGGTGIVVAVDVTDVVAAFFLVSLSLSLSSSLATAFLVDFGINFNFDFNFDFNFKDDDDDDNILEGESITSLDRRRRITGLEGNLVVVVVVAEVSAIVVAARKEKPVARLLWCS